MKEKKKENEGKEKKKDSQKVGKAKEEENKIYDDSPKISKKNIQNVKEEEIKVSLGDDKKALTGAVGASYYQILVKAEKIFNKDQVNLIRKIAAIFIIKKKIPQTEIDYYKFIKLIGKGILLY